jgi:hypothetical protein
MILRTGYTMDTADTVDTVDTVDTATADRLLDC